MALSYLIHEPLQIGQRVKAKITVWDLPGNEFPGYIHAIPGEMGTVIHHEPGHWAAVRFDRTRTISDVSPAEVEVLDMFIPEEYAI